MPKPEVIVLHNNYEFKFFKYNSSADPSNFNSPIASVPLYEEVILQENEMTKMNENVAYGVN